MLSGKGPHCFNDKIKYRNNGERVAMAWLCWNYAGSKSSASMRWSYREKLYSITASVGMAKRASKGFSVQSS